MPIDDVDDIDTGRETGDVTNLRLDRATVNQLKSEAGVSSNTEVAPLVEAAILEYIGEDSSDKVDEFRGQFENED